MNTTSSLTILLLAWIHFQLVLATPARAATRVWTNGVPVDGDSVLLLRHPLGSFVSAVNDLTNLTLASIRCEAIGYNLGGGASLFVTAIKNFGRGELSVTGSVTIAGCSLAFQPGSSIITQQRH